MAFWRPWVRTLLGAWGVTLLLPAGLLVAVALAATLGGAGLGGLSQLVSGPQLPGGRSTTVAESGVPAGAVPALPVGATPRKAGRDRSPVAREPTRPSARRPGSSRPQSGTITKPQPGSGGRPPATPIPQQPATTPSPPSSGPTTKPPPSSVLEPVVEPIAKPVRSTLQRIGDATKSVLNRLPVLGKPLADAVGTVVDLLSGPLPK